MKILFLLFGLSLTLHNANATSVLPISLEQMSIRANLIFHAKVIANKVKVDDQSGQIATYTEFKIIDSIKGNVDATHTIKQIGGRHENSQIIMRVHGVPSFQTGKNYVVFLPKPSILGFCSPLGLYQGSFSVTTINGEQIVNNAHAALQSSSNAEKTAKRAVQVPLAVNANKPSQSRLNDFMNTVRAYNTK